MGLARYVRAFCLRSCAGGTEENGVGEFRIFWDFWEILGWDADFLIFLGNLSFLGFKRDGNHYIYFLRCNIY